MTTTGVIHTIAASTDSGELVAGDPGGASNNSGGDPIGVAVNSSGKVYVTNIGYLVVLTPTGTTITPAPFVVAKNSASGYGGFGQLGQGSWIEIYRQPVGRARRVR